MNRLWELILKIFLHSPEMNCSIFFSMYLLRMTKKMNYFETSYAKRECFPGSISIQFVRKSIPSSTKIFVSMIFNHSITELWISFESVMDSMEILLFFNSSSMDLLYNIICLRAFFTISMSMRWSLLDDIHRG